MKANVATPTAIRISALHTRCLGRSATALRLKSRPTSTTGAMTAPHTGIMMPMAWLVLSGMSCAALARIIRQKIDQMTTMDFKIMAVRTGFVAQGSTPNHALQLSKLGLTYMDLADAHVLVSR